MTKKQGVPAAFSKLEDIRRYVTAGEAKVTLVSKRTGERYTYRISKQESCYFVDVLTGSNNEADYSALGIIYGQKGTHFGFVTKQVPNKVAATAPSAQGFDWFWRALREQRADLLDKVEVWHEGRCSMCHRPLTVPSSIARGMGETCANKG